MFGGFKSGGFSNKHVSSKPIVKGPAIEPCKPAKNSSSVKSAGVVWEGLFTGPSGYAKANREIVKRLSETVQVWMTSSPEDAERATAEENVPQVTFLPPHKEASKRHKIIYTMMETPTVHWDMIGIMNSNYNECWTPTRWNAETFRKSGLKIPIRVMPLGIDPNVYRPDGEAWMPPALRLTGRNAGNEEIPTGYLFIYLCQPTFRKGIEVLLEAFDEAFGKDQEAGLIIATTAHETPYFTPEPGVRSRIWLMTGSYDESELASIYRACDAYACTSRGEGFNMPVVEAAACGLPVVVPRTSVHPELVPEGCGFFFDSDRSKVFKGAGDVSKWFEDIPFPDYGRRSRKQLVEVLRRVKNERTASMQVGKKYMNHVRSRYKWALVEDKIARRLKELCGR
jgi:glycosyltransferase involved in cell wall biosynthesis